MAGAARAADFLSAMHSPRRHTERRAKVTLLDLIRRNHLDHDARVAVVRAIRGAEVAVFGASAASLTEQLAAILRPCGAYVVDAIGASTRFAVATPEATMREIDEVRLIGLPMLTPRDIHEMAKTFTSVTQLADVRSAARRAREDSARRLPKAQRPVIARCCSRHARVAWPRRARRGDPRSSRAERATPATARCIYAGASAKKRPTSRSTCAPCARPTGRRPSSITGVHSRGLLRYSGCAGVVSERLRSAIGNRVVGVNPARGFESLPLRSSSA